MSLVDKIKDYNRRKLIEKVKSNPSFVSKMKNPDEEIQLVAVDTYNYIIKYFSNASEKVQLAHVNRWGAAYFFNIVNPCDNAKIASIMGF